jgi:polar amino acid transport system substrate-binding protein
MKQVLHDFNKGQIILADVPRPGVQPNSVLVRNLFSVVSPGTERAVIQGRSRNVVRTALERKDLVQRVMAKARRDGILAAMQAVKRKLEASLPLGYSCAGTAVEVGSDIGDIRPGDRVACAGAGFACHAEYVCVPRMLCARVPDGVAPDAAAFTTLGAIALHGVRQAEIACGETVAVIGLGIMGQLVCQIVEAAGGRPIGLDIAPARVEIFRKLCRGSAVVAGAGAEQQVIELTEGRGADRVIITAASRSNEAIELAAAIARDRGRIVVLGGVLMQLPRQPFYEKELELRLSRSYGPGRYDAEYEIGGVDYPVAYVRWTENRNMQEFLRLVGNGAVRPLELVTHRYAIEDAVKAYDAMGNSAAPPLGMVIAYPSESSERAPQRVTLRSRPRPKGKVGVAVVGAGNFARSVLLPTLAKMSDVSLEAVASARGVNARDLATKYGCDFCTTSFDEVIASDKVDAVFIATPHNLHADQALKALAAGKAVYLEKPLCISEEQLARLEEGVRGAEACLFVGFNRRFAPMTVRMQEVFAGRKSPVTLHYRVNAGALPSGNWYTAPEIGGGRIVGEACHFVDFAKFIVGRPVREVTARATAESRDDVVVMLHFDDGSVATISYVTSGPSAYPKEYVEVLGADKACVIDDFQRFSLCHGRRKEEVAAKQDKGHRAALAAFIECCQGKRERPFSLADLADTTRITFTMRDGIERTPQV